MYISLQLASKVIFVSMKRFYALFLTVLLYVSGLSQTSLVSGPASGTTYLVPFVSQCLNTNPQNASVCSGGVIGTFNFTSVQCCACPSSGMICLPGSVAYGGPGTSASFTNYHTLSYSPSNEHQQFVFSAPITKFQFSVAGPAGASEVFQAQTYNGGTLLSTHTFLTGGTGVRLTYTITGGAFTRVQFTEINAISADDELFGDVYVDAGTCAILPFELLNFAAHPINDHEVKVSWQTNGEIDNQLFIAEHSADGANWSEIASVPGAGTTTEARSYQIFDRSPFPGTNYYRLLTIDGQGDAHYSQIVAINMNQDQAKVIVYPNPVGDWLRFNFGNITGTIDLSFVNQLGQIVKQKTCTESLSALEVTELPAGIYTLRITLPDGTTSNQSIIKK
jgi:hypothetical protein